MCSLTWYLKHKEYAIFFNRDERKQRQIAIPPHFYAEQKYIMPIDPDGQGTWIGVNQMGYSFCLLNHYQVGTAQVGASQLKSLANTIRAISLTEKQFLSRGKLIPKLLPFNSFTEISHYLATIQYKQFQPFLLVIFAPELIFKPQPKIATFSWNGITAGFVDMQQPIISTSVKFQLAQQNRTMLFKKIFADQQPDAQKHYAFHQSHFPEQGPLSVCMHRDDATSVSFSHISVTKEIRFSYKAGSPCQNQPLLTLQMPNQGDYF